jgi:hypothetical protein
MTTSTTAPSEADAPRPWARAILHARIPVALKLLLLALLAALSKAEAPRHLLRVPRQDWFIATHTNPNDEPDFDIDWYELRRRRRARAEIGWLLRGTRNRGMTLSGHRTSGLRPERMARAPPWRDRAKNHPESVLKTPPRAAPTRARSKTRPSSRKNRLLP